MKVRKNIAISESGFVFDPTSGDSFSLNEIGATILQKMKEGAGMEEIKSHFMENYDVDASSFERYYYDFIGMLRQFHLVEEE